MSPGRPSPFAILGTGQPVSHEPHGVTPGLPYPVVLEEEPEPLLDMFGHGWVVDGVFVDGVVEELEELAGVLEVDAAPETTVPRPKPRPRVPPAMPMPNRTFLRGDVMCSSPFCRRSAARWAGRTLAGSLPTPTLDHANLGAGWHGGKPLIRRPLAGGPSRLRSESGAGPSSRRRVG